MNSITAIVVAAGRGTRAGSGIPKQYREIAQKPILHYTIDALLAHKEIDNIICVIHKDDKQLYKNAVSRINNPRLSKPVLGGETRSQSVFNGIKAASSEYVLIHDGARPCLPIAALKRLINGLEKYNACFLALPIVDTLWSISENKVQKNISREMIWKAQTPQAFNYKKLFELQNNKGEEVTDDANLFVRAGKKIKIIKGETTNNKITIKSDIKFNNLIKFGIGFDVHRLVPNKKLYIGGIKIPSSIGTLGHSDGDPVLHAVTDAILGACSMGDIGEKFSDKNKKFKNIRSTILLSKIIKLTVEKGYLINNLDINIITQKPKIQKYKKQITNCIAKICNISPAQVNIKGKTTEKLGVIGKEKAIACEVIASVIKND